MNLVAKCSPVKSAILSACLLSSLFSGSSVAMSEPLERTKDLYPGIAKLCKPVEKSAIDAYKNYVYKFPELIPEAKVFDNFYFLGNVAASSWALDTSGGIILIDTLDSEEESKVSIEGGLRKLGMDPSRIKMIIVSHGHLDHYGGARYLAAKYNAQVIMGEKDWDLVEQQAKIGLPAGFTFPYRDRGISSEDNLTLGNTTVQLIETPGHTPGSLSLIFPIIDHGVSRNVVFWGGMGLGLGTDVSRYKNYADSAKLMKAKAISSKAEIFISNHVKFDEADKKIINNTLDRSQNAFVKSTDDVAGAFDLLSNCAQLQASFIR